MSEHKEVTGTIQVPANTGIDGFLHTIKELLKRPRLQSINIDARGRITFRRFALEGEDDGAPNNNFGVDFQDLSPYYVVRNVQVLEFAPPRGATASTCVCMLLDRMAKDKMHPLAFVSGASTMLWDWHRYTTGYEIEERTQLFGLPLLLDRHIPDTALLLCAGYGREAAFIDTRLSYKVEMPQYGLPPADVQVLP